VSAANDTALGRRQLKAAAFGGFRVFEAFSYTFKIPSPRQFISLIHRPKLRVHQSDTYNPDLPEAG
jgi:hypothetical protein